MTIYILERKDKNGFAERIQALQPRKGWKIVEKRFVKMTDDGHCIDESFFA